MNLANVVKSLLNLQKEIKKEILPSQGYFYKDDFKIFIKRADIENIIEYEWGYKNDISIIIEKIKKIVKDNTTFSQGYKFEDIKSIDIIFIFLEIVKFTKNDKVYFVSIDDFGNQMKIEFNSDSFNYFKPNKFILEKYNNKDKCFDINGYKYSLPSIGVENSLTKFLMSIPDKPESSVYNNYFYDFTHFLGDKNHLSHKEIDNLIQIFNKDLEKSEFDKVNQVLKEMKPFQRYSLKKDGITINLTAKLDLENIWK